MAFYALPTFRNKALDKNVHVFVTQKLSCFATVKRYLFWAGGQKRFYQKREKGTFFALRNNLIRRAKTCLVRIKEMAFQAYGKPKKTLWLISIFFFSCAAKCTIQLSTWRHKKKVIKPTQHRQLSKGWVGQIQAMQSHHKGIKVEHKEVYKSRSWILLMMYCFGRCGLLNQCHSATCLLPCIAQSKHRHVLSCIVHFAAQENKKTEIKDDLYNSAPLPARVKRVFVLLCPINSGD